MYINNRLAIHNDLFLVQVLFDRTGTKPYMSPELHIAVDLQIFIPIHLYLLV